MEHIREHEQLLRLSDFDYPCPPHLIAQEPIPNRSASKLLVRRQDRSIVDMHVADLTTEVPAGSLLIFNESKVFPSRMLGRLATGGSVEVFLLSEIKTSENNPNTVWQALGRPMKKLKPGAQIYFEPQLRAHVLDRYDDHAGNGLINLEFDTNPGGLADWLDRHGYIPLPPYIKRSKPMPAECSPDRDRYQTVYARHPGSVAAPTAGLHFTDTLIGRLRSHGIGVHFVSLHVGAGTFLPVKTENIADHIMHSERYKVGKSTAAAICEARRNGQKVIAVGTTTFRSLESLFRRAANQPDKFIEIADQWHSTDLFLRPSSNDDIYRPWVIDALFTNFHQPCSTLFMLIAAVIGLNAAKEMYAEAVSREYRFFSYGDANLLWL